MESEGRLDIDQLLVDFDAKLKRIFDDLHRGDVTSSQQLLKSSVSLQSHIDSTLQRDAHFQELLSDTQRHSREMWNPDLEVSRKKQIVLAAILKILLKACLSVSEIYSRKVFIEKIYNFYRDRRQVVFEEIMATRPSSAPVGVFRRKRELSAKSTTSMTSNAWTQPANVGGNRVSGVPYADDDADNFVFSDEEDDEDDQDPAIEYENQAPFPSSFSRSSSRPDSADIPSRPYSSSSASRPLSAARRRYELDDVSDSGLNQMHARRPASSGYVGMDSRKPQQDELRKIARKKFMSVSRRNLARSHATRTGMSDELLELSIQGHGAESSSQNVTYQPTFLHYRRPLDRPMASMHKVWLTKKAEEVKEQIEQRQINETMTTWNYNRARVEEEIIRRQESCRFSSQTGVRIHTCSSPTPSSRSQMSSAGRPMSSLSSRPSSRASTVLDRPSSRLGPSYQRPSSAVTSQVAHLPKKKSIEETLWKDVDDMKSVDFDELEEDAPAPSRNFLFSTPRPPSTKGIRLTPYNNPDIQEKIPKLRLSQLEFGAHDDDSSMTSEELDENRPKTTSRPPTGSIRGFMSPHPETEPKKIVRPTVTTEDIVQRLAEEIKEKARVQDMDARVEQRLAEMYSDPNQAPSEYRVQQLDECRRIKECFAQKNIPLRARTIYNAIVIPEDRQLEDCMKRLPSVRSRLLSDPTRPTEKKKGKGKKGGKKKGGKKKKK